MYHIDKTKKEDVTTYKVFKLDSFINIYIMFQTKKTEKENNEEAAMLSKLS